MRLLGEDVLLEDEEGEREVTAAVAVLEFEYPHQRVRPTADDEFALPDEERDMSAESVAARVLESLGALEIAHLSGFLPDYDSIANYLITFASELHVGCSFAAYAVPQLQQQGFRVTIDDSFPFPTSRRLRALVRNGRTG